GAFISKVKMHGREPSSAVVERFYIADVARESQELLAHRLRASGCQIEVREEPSGLTLVGDPARLGQVLINLIGNSIDAYEDQGGAGGPIEVLIDGNGAAIKLVVRDSAGGIPPDVLPHIFDELFTTKEAGRGTGLGLWIARNLIEQSFMG